MTPIGAVFGVPSSVTTRAVILCCSIWVRASEAKGSGAMVKGFGFITSAAVLWKA